MYRKLFPVLLITAALSLPAAAPVKKYDHLGNVESITSTELAVLFFDPPESGEYLLFADNRNIGTFNAMARVHIRKGKYSWRVSGSYTLLSPDHVPLLKAGSPVMLKAYSSKDRMDYANKYYIEKLKFKKNIISKIDNREMNLIPAGKFIMGSSHGDSDERPEHTVYLPDFYMDVYEVSNSDYAAYVETANSAPPKSWVSGKIQEGEGGLPVMVTYSEAERYARWCRKRLPSEQEWEKAAGWISENGKDSGQSRMFPWGNDFGSENANSLEYWEKQNIVPHKDSIDAEKKIHPAPLPVIKFSGIDSPYGIRNLSGNAREWTSSWFLPYPGNKKKNKYFGTQYKVVRGGAWYQGRDDLRVTKRAVGGSPSLKSDNTSGFRCVKDPDPLEKEK